MTEPAKLLPCPFCDGQAAFNKVSYGERTIAEQGWDQETYFGVNCISCCVNNVGPRGFETEAMAAEAWNRRSQAGSNEPVAWMTTGLNGAINSTTQYSRVEYWQSQGLPITPLYTHSTPKSEDVLRLAKALGDLISLTDHATTETLQHIRSTVEWQEARKTWVMLSPESDYCLCDRHKNNCTHPYPPCEAVTSAFSREEGGGAA